MRAIHIGFPKTATTFLQATLFPELAAQGFAYVGKLASARTFASLIDDDDSLYDAAATLAELRRESGGADHVLASYEGLTGHHYRSGFVNRSQIARRLKQLGFDRAIITIRNQFDVLESAYKQYVASGGVLRFRDYVTFQPGEPSYLHPRYFDYDLVHRIYGEAFGRDRVLVLQFEELQEPAFASDLAAFLGVRPIEVDRRARANESLSRGKLAVLRACNHLTYSSYHPSSLLSKRFSTATVHRMLRALPFGEGDRSIVDGPTRDTIAAFYAESNHRLAQAAGIDLSAAYP